MDVISISSTDSDDSMVLIEFDNKGREEHEQTTALRQSSTTRNKEVEVVTLSSKSRNSTERCPVTWSHSPKKSNLNLLNSNTFCSPSPRSKVSIWLYGNGQRSSNSTVENSPQDVEQQLKTAITNLLGNGNGQKNSNSTSENSPQDITEQKLKTAITNLLPSPTTKSSILVRQDYKKSPNVNPILNKVFMSTNRHVSNVNVENNGVIYLEDENEVTQAANTLNSSHKTKYKPLNENAIYNVNVTLSGNTNSTQNSKPAVSEFFQKHWKSAPNLRPEQMIPEDELPLCSSTPQLVQNMHNLVENMSHLCDSQPAFTDSSSSSKSDVRRKIQPLTSVPLSPETQKKIELCEYLKLMNMNPSDKKTVGLRQNRRSSRVKHLALMSERRELERKLNSETRELERKKSSKSSDSDSRHSTDNDSSKGLKLPEGKKADSPVLRKTPTQRDTPSRSSSQDETKPQSSHKRNEKSSGFKTPSKFLQVPEVSTTSVPKSKTPVEASLSRHTTASVESVMENKRVLTNRKSNNSEKSFIRRPSSSRSRQTDKENNSNSSEDSDITKKSFMQLCLNINNFKAVRSSSKSSNHDNKANTPLFSLIADTVSNIPDTIDDFDEVVKSFVDETSLKKSPVSTNHQRIKKPVPPLPRADLKMEKRKTLRSNIKAKLRYRKPNEVKMLSKKKKPETVGNAKKSKISKINGLLERIKFKKRNNKKDSNKSKKLSSKSTKDIYKKKNYASPQSINRLRSRGRLKRVGIKSILLKEKRKKAIKKKVKQIVSQELQEIKVKDFISAELIQHGSENNPLAGDIKDVSNTVTVRQNESADRKEKSELVPTSSINLAFSPLRSGRLNKSDLDFLKNLTPEHRKAIFESKKFLIGKMKETTINSMQCPTTSPTKTALGFIKSDTKETYTNTPHEQKDSSVDKELQILEPKVVPSRYTFQRIETHSDKLHKLNKTHERGSKIVRSLSCINISLQTETEPQASRPCSEDLEVDQLMSCKLGKSQAMQIDSESPEFVTGETLTEADPDHVRCSSSSSNAQSSNTWSLQTVESDPESSNCTSKPDIEVACVSPSCELQLQVSDSVVEITSSTKETDMEVCQNGYNFSKRDVNQPEVIDISTIQPTTCDYVQLDIGNEQEVKSLHHYLTQPAKKARKRSHESSRSTQQNWEENFETEKSSKTDRRTSQSHTIYLSNENGAILSAYYLDYTLIIVQELVVSFWNQTPLGNVLGTQHMWIPKGNIQRLVLGNGCVHKESSETVISLETSIAYVELWTKEHKSDKRERPVADIFVTIYLKTNRSGPEKKVLQLENINGYASDVQYIVLRNSRNIIVSWNVNADSVSSTLVHCYQLSPDYQTVTSIRVMQAVSHYVSSLHNIEDCDTLIMGCGDDKITLWNMEHGYVVATIDLMVTNQQPRILWAKCDRGFLFTLHHFNDGLLSLIAINTFDSTWKKLQVYKPAQENDNLLGVCMEKGLVVAFYDSSVLCWKAETGELIVEDTYEDSVFLPFGKYVVVVLKNQVHVRHALEYLVNNEDS